MRAIDNYTDEEREVLALKGMTAPRTAIERLAQARAALPDINEVERRLDAPNKAQPQHSPLPWKIDEAEDLPLAIIEDTEDGYGVCELEFSHTEQAKANAKLIVRAVNGYDKAIQALRELVRTIDRDNLSGRYPVQQAKDELAAYESEAQ